MEALAVDAPAVGVDSGQIAMIGVHHSGSDEMDEVFDRWREPDLHHPPIKEYLILKDGRRFVRGEDFWNFETQLIGDTGQCANRLMATEAAWLVRPDCPEICVTRNLDGVRDLGFRSQGYGFGALRASASPFLFCFGTYGGDGYYTAVERDISGDPALFWITKTVERFSVRLLGLIQTGGTLAIVDPCYIPRDTGGEIDVRASEDGMTAVFGAYSQDCLIGAGVLMP